MTPYALDASGSPFDHRYRVIARGMSRKGRFRAGRVFRPLSGACFNGRDNNAIKLDWFTNFLESHRNYPQGIEAISLNVCSMCELFFRMQYFTKANLKGFLIPNDRYYFLGLKIVPIVKAGLHCIWGMSFHPDSEQT